MRNLLSATILFFALTTCLLAQDFASQYTKPGEWQFTKRDDLAIKSVLQLETENKQDGIEYDSGGTGVLIEIDESQSLPDDENLIKCLILTCHHVIENATKIDVINHNGSQCIDIEVVNSNEHHDIALISAYIDKSCVPISIAKNVPSVNSKLRLAGFGQRSGSKFRYFKSRLFRGTDDILIVNTDISPGDSGGPVINENNKLVGLISRGIIPFTKNQKGHSYTSPAICPSIRPINKLISKYKNRSKKEKLIVEIGQLPRPILNSNEILLDYQRN